METVNKALATNPQSVELRMRKAAVNLELQQWQYAIDEYSSLLNGDREEKCKELGSPHEAWRMAALYFRAYANNQLRRYELARNDYYDILRQQPSNMEARLGLAYTLGKLNREAEALDEMNTLVEQHPDSAVVYAARANIERELQQYDAALYDWDEAISRSPSTVDYYVSKADVLLAQGRKQEAKETLDRAVANGAQRGALREWYARCR